MIHVYEPEQSAACHQTWICQVAVSLPGDEEHIFTSNTAVGVEEPLDPSTSVALQRAALEQALRYIRFQQGEKV